MSKYQMSIKEAKQEITNTLHIYRSKNELGQYEIPVSKQRPILLMGPPGIGKTAIMEQIASEEKVALVSYTITHHTRQSAVGLPVIRDKKYGNETFSVTEYTMSEIIASVYDKMEQTGLSEGILFLDEINCVSETLAPTMLQFLQYKTFGSHKLPEGWVIVAAGNPQEYNKSVRDFDIVTLDRLKRIDITEDYPAWKEYAYAHEVHAAILSYLDIKKENFYQVHSTIEGEDFVTARGWEDLSRFLYACENKDFTITTSGIHQYLQHEEIARDFSNYYDLFLKYKQSYDVSGILSGKEDKAALERLSQASFDETLSVIGLFLGTLSEQFADLHSQDETLTLIHKTLQEWKAAISSSSKTADVLFLENYQRMEQKMKREKNAGQLTEENEHIYLSALHYLNLYIGKLRSSLTSDPETAFDLVKNLFGETVTEYESCINDIQYALTNTFTFLEQVFAGKQEMVLFVTELAMNPHASWFLSEHGCDKFYEYNKDLLIDEKKQELQRKISQSVHRMSHI